MLPVTFGIHKTFLLAGSLAARLGPKPVYRNAECRGGAFAKLPKASNGSKLRAQGMQNTSQQKCFPLPLESIKHVLWPAPSLRGWVRNQYTAINAECRGGGYAKLPKASNSSKIRAQGMQNTSQKKGKPKTVRSQPFHMVPKLLATDPKRPNATTSRARASQKRCVRNPSTRCRNCSFEAVKKNTGKGP